MVDRSHPEDYNPENLNPEIEMLDDVILQLAKEVQNLRSLLPYARQNTVCDVKLECFDIPISEAMMILGYILPKDSIHTLRHLCRNAMAGENPIVTNCVDLVAATQWKKDFKKLGLHLQLTVIK